MQDVTRASSSDDIGDDVVMREDNPNSSGSDSRRRITTERESREVRYAQPSVTVPHVPRKICGKRTLSEYPVASYHTRGTGRIPQENNESRERREQYIEL